MILSVFLCCCVFVAVFCKRPPLMTWSQTPAKLLLTAKVPDATEAKVVCIFTNSTITIDADPYFASLTLLRPINATASSFSVADGKLIISAVKARREPCWLRLIDGEKAIPAWLSVDHATIDFEGCRFYRELWRSEYFSNMLDEPRSKGNSNWRFD